MAIPLGYEFKPSKYEPALGYAGLEVRLLNKPVGGFFDTKVLEIPILEMGFFRREHFSMVDTLLEAKQVSMGRIILRSFDGEVKEVFSFGGSLHASHKPGLIECELISSAPIFSLQDDPHSISRIVSDELIALEAKLIAEWKTGEDGFYERLAEFDPYQLFISSLETLRSRIDEAQARSHSPNLSELSHLVDKAIHTVKTQDGWPEAVPTLEGLVAREG